MLMGGIGGFWGLWGRLGGRFGNGYEVGFDDGTLFFGACAVKVGQLVVGR